MDPPAAGTDGVVQFKVWLHGISPMVWRRLLVLDTCTLREFAVVSKRFAKRQQMQWTKRGAHLLLQTRTRALDGTLRLLFESWYPGMANDN
jgi:hypothetical protein